MKRVESIRKNSVNPFTTIANESTFNMGSGRLIECRVQFLSFGTIDLINEVFLASVIVKCRWTDKNKITDYDPKKHWNPELYIENAQTIPAVNWIENITYTTRLVRDFTEITEERNITGYFWERMELNDFPLDIQSLSINIASKLDPRTEPLRLMPDSEKISSIHPRAFFCFHEQQKYKLYNLVKTGEKASYEEESEYDTTITSATFSAGVEISRKSGFYLINNFFIAFLICVLSLTLFSEVPENVGNRISASFTLLLTMFAFKITTSSQLPTISYLTITDLYQGMGAFYIFALCIYYSIIRQIQMDPAAARKIDENVIYGFIGVLVLMHIVIVFLIIKIKIDLYRIRKQEKEYENIIKSIKHYDIRDIGH